MGYSSQYVIFKIIMKNICGLTFHIIVNYSFYSADALITDVAWIPNKHYSGVYGLLKLTLPKVLPQTVDKILVFDCDVTFSADIADLWAVISLFTSNQVNNLFVNCNLIRNLIVIHFIVIGNWSCRESK